MSIAVLHYHFRSGGVRSVIKRSLPVLARLCRRIGGSKIVLTSGGGLPSEELSQWQSELPELDLIQEVDPAFSYLDEISNAWPGLAGRIRQSAVNLIRRHQTRLVWAHNLSLGRNPFLGLGWSQACESTGSMLLCQHHDWWPDLRWQRWSEMQNAGISNLEEAAAATIPDGPRVRHVAVHPRDAAILQKFCGSRAAWLPNLPVVPQFKSSIEARSLHSDVRPLWLIPTRILRRKNVLEAVLLAKLLHPEATLGSLGQASSQAEMNYAKAVKSAVDCLRFKWMPGLAESAPAASVLSSAEVLLQTSIHEGFGLAATDAAAYHKPLLLRRLPLLTDWMNENRHSLATCYDDLEVPASWIPPDDHQRASELMADRSSLLPPAWRQLVRKQSQPRFFSELTLAGQLVVLERTATHPEAWLRSNPWLESWQSMARKGRFPAVLPRSPVQDEEAAWEETVNDLLASPDGHERSRDILEAIASSVLPTAARHPLLLE